MTREDFMELNVPERCEVMQELEIRIRLDEQGQPEEGEASWEDHAEMVEKYTEGGHMGEEGAFGAYMEGMSRRGEGTIEDFMASEGDAFGEGDDDG